MKKSFMRMNLQKFAEPVIDEPVIEEPVIEEPVVTEEPIIEEVITEEPVVDELMEEPVIDPPKPNDHVPLTKYMQEKKKRQELEKVLAQQDIEREKLNITTDYINRGWPETEAVRFAQRDIQHKTEMESMNSKLAKLLDLDIMKLAQNNDFYEDAESFSDEIKEKMNQFNCSAKEAYMLVRGETRSNEMQLKKEQRTAAQRKQTTSKTVATAKPVVPTTTYKLDDDDKKALAMLQKAQPDAGWSTEKYHKLMKT